MFQFWTHFSKQTYTYVWSFDWFSHFHISIVRKWNTLYNFVMDRTHAQCKKNWLSNIFYVNNIVNQGEEGAVSCTQQNNANFH